MDEQTQVNVRNWLKRAQENLRAAELEFNSEFYARAISTAYYAMFYAATGALASIGIQLAKHSGVASAFGEHFVRSGKIGGEFGHMLRQTMEDREESDYAAVPVVDRTLAQRHLDEARGFVSAVTQHLRQQGLKTE
ncbi:MAG: hypothetical protein HW378_4773 [Anaerolineales bacterium]|nr:hypothetical protein [Anaerolineales bacterium]